MVQNLTDDVVKQIHDQNEETVKSLPITEEGNVVDDLPPYNPTASTINPGSDAEKELRSYIESGEWDNLDHLEGFKNRTPEGQLMARTEAIDCRVRQLEVRLPMMLNQHLHDAYIQILKKIHALRKTKSALFYFFYKNEGQRDLNSSR